MSELLGVETAAPARQPRGTAHGALLSLIAIVALGGTRFIYSIIVGRVAGPSVLGPINTALAFAMLASLFMSAGTSPAASKFVAAAGGDRATAAKVTQWLSRWTFWGTLVTLVVAAPAAIWALHGPSAVELVLVLALIASYAAYTFTKGLLYGSGHIPRYVVLEVATDLVALGLTVLVVLLSRSLLLLPLVVGYSAFSVRAWRRRPRSLRHERPSVTAWREMRSFVVLSIVGTVASSGFLQLSMIMARRYGGNLEAGYYAAAMALIAPAYLLPRALSLALFPAMAGAFGRGDRSAIRRQTDIATRIIAVVMLPGFVAVAVLAGPVLHAFFGSRFEAGTLVLQLLVAATFVSVISVPAVNSLSAVEAKYVGVSAWASVAGLAVGAAVWATLAPDGGATAVAFGYLVGSVVQSAVPIAVSWRRYRLHWMRLWTLVLCGVGAATLLTWLLRTSGGSLTALGVAVAFALGWFALSTRDLKNLRENLILAWRTSLQRRRTRTRSLL